MPVSRGGAEALGQSGSQSLGVLIAKAVPGKFVDPDPARGEDSSHRHQSTSLGPPGPRRQACQIHGHRVPGWVADGNRGQVIVGSWEVGIGHRTTF